MFALNATVIPVFNRAKYDQIIAHLGPARRAGPGFGSPLGFTGATGWVLADIRDADDQCHALFDAGDQPNVSSARTSPVTHQRGPLAGAALTP